MKRSVTYFCIFSLILTGCSSIKFNGSDRRLIGISKPPIAKVVTANIGEPLLKKIKKVEVKVLQVNETVDGSLFDIPQGAYKKVGRDGNADYYSANGVKKSGIAAPPEGLKIEKKKGAEICVVTVNNGAQCYEANYDIRERIAEEENSLQQTLLYSGKVGEKVKISYREFENNMARPAFTNEAVYDLSSSNIIGYKGARIRVISATNNEITYKLLKNFP